MDGKLWVYVCVFVVQILVQETEDIMGGRTTVMEHIRQKPGVVNGEWRKQLKGEEPWMPWGRDTNLYKHV